MTKKQKWRKKSFITVYLSLSKLRFYAIPSHITKIVSLCSVVVIRCYNLERFTFIYLQSVFCCVGFEGIIIAKMFFFWKDPENLFILYALYSSCVVVPISLLFGYIKLTAGRTPTCKSRVKLIGKTAIVTGANCGIGKETALDFARRGARVILACRNEKLGREAAKEISEATLNRNVEYRHLDLSALTSVRRFAEDIINSEQNLHILVNNAGIGDQTGADKHKLTQENLDLVFGVNHIGHFLLTYLLLDLLKKSSPARIVNVSSGAYTYHRKPLDFNPQPDQYGKIYPGLSGYMISKLANIMHARELAKRLAGTGVTANALHPGVVNSQIWRDVHKMVPFFIHIPMMFIIRNACLDNKAGAQTSIFLSVDEGVRFVTGEYFRKSAAVPMKPLALDDSACKKLWDVSLKICGLPSE